MDANAPGDEASETDTDQGRSIFEAVQGCLDLSKDYLACIGDCGSTDKVWGQLLDQRGRLRTWAYDMGVFTIPRLSLDYRLRGSREAKTLILSQLDMIERRLRRGLASCLNQEDRQADPLVGFGSEPGKTASAMVKPISKNIDMLVSISTTIHHPTRFNFRPQVGQCNEGIMQDRPLYQAHYAVVRRNFPDLVDELVSRLAAAMVLQTERIERNISTSALKAFRPSAPRRRLGDNSLPRRSEPSSAASRTIQEDKSTRPTGWGIALLRGSSTSSPSPSNGSSSNVFEEPSIQSRVPCQPRVGIAQSEFICPFCGIIRPADEARDEESWRKHVIMDLDPYICLFRSCSSAEQIFSTRASWLEHMRKAHNSRWKCRICPGSVGLFNNARELDFHISSEHAHHLLAGERASLIKNSEISAGQIFESCPFCHAQGDQLERHIERHLVLLALMAIP
ncbi:hypothetical protein GQ53DRAFT_648635, partial [Thozetella sp. PMI_491]